MRGDQVLKKILSIQKDFRGKWIPNWKRPYIMKKAFLGEALILTEIDCRDLPNPVSSDSIKRGHKKEKCHILGHQQSTLDLLNTYQAQNGPREVFSENYKSYLPEVAVEQTEDSESYFPEVAVEQLKPTNYKSDLPKVAVE
ncbi:RNA-directed DNA polymerase (Reverse transcriptase), Ribonuclease H [Gossypium australe]|uniref:RNA-directed DNA polymerase (Reverse transcriptase), Ribonuclease H n=1 Tax=Gossypium australe TaxID=47621 RepID=A0A5B6X512_9ROSI|nr:RNA-directed DNA polymerase (Reverse transcriptase), Ribonuclease H [Gossypium australe]